jgi:hypothetical protein
VLVILRGPDCFISSVLWRANKQGGNNSTSWR